MGVVWEYDFEAGCVNGKDFWYCAMQFNAFFHLNLETGEQEFLGSVPNEELYKDRLYGGMQFCNDKIVFIPFSANYLSVYDIVTKEFSQYEIPSSKEKYKNYNKDFKWQGSILHDNKVYMFGLTHAAIGVFDVEKCAFTCNYEWLDIVRQKKGFEVNDIDRGFLFEKNVVSDSNNIYASMGVANAILKYDIESGKYDLIIIGDGDDRFYNMKLVDDVFVLFYKNRNAGLITYDHRQNKIKERIKNLCDVNITNGMMLDCVGRKMIVTLEKGGIIETSDDFRDASLRNESDNKYCTYYATETSDGVIFYTHSDNRINIIRSDNTCVEYKLYSDERINDLLKNKCINVATNGILHESNNYTVTHYIEAIAMN